MAYIRARDLSKVFRSGAADLVIFETSTWMWIAAKCWRWWANRAPAKSTLLHLLGGLDRPSEGTIYYGGREISGLADAERADFRNREIGFVWQIHYLLPEFTALENVMMPLLIRGWPHGRGRCGIAGEVG